VYLQQIDNPSGFMLDLSTRIYSWYGGTNLNWEKTLSSITVIMPVNPGELPHGWYHMSVAANGQFSEGHMVQVTIPRPGGLTTVPIGSVLGSTSIQWAWDQNTLGASDGYSVFASSNDVFISTVPFGAPDPTIYVQTGLGPNTAASIKVGGYNLGGYSAFQRSATYYTLAVAPRDLNVDAASFETATVSWDPMGNSALTIYEVSLSSWPDFSSDVIVPIPFNNNYTSSGAVINQLKPNQDYYFRVRARNMGGINTDYDDAYMAGLPVSTVTVGNINNLAGTPLTMSVINWAWDPSTGADFYEAYDITAGTASAVFIGSTTVYSLDQVNLSTNTAHTVRVNAVRTTASGPVRGPVTISNPVYTLAVSPLPGVPSVFTNITTGTLTINWIANGNPSRTPYQVSVAQDINFTSSHTFTVIGTSASLSGLVPNERFFFRLTAVNSAGLITAPILLGSEYTKAQAPTDFAPTNISMSGITLAWNTGANSTGTLYEVRGTTTPGFTTGIVTYAPFSHYAVNTLSLTGLLTATTYYFDIAAKNGSGVVTARTQLVPAVYSLPGPGGAPSGSIGGTSRPGVDVTIEGMLPNGRFVSLFVPADSFAAPTQIAISSSITDSCDRGAVPLVEVAIYTQDNAQPQAPITLKLSYTDTEVPANSITDNRASLVLARAVTGECLPLETSIDTDLNTITAKLNHFSVFQLMIKPAAATLSAARVYPNPFYTNRGQGFITIDRLPASTKVRIYTLSGGKIWEGTAGTTGVLTWNAVNDSGFLAGSGVYLAVIDSGSKKKVLKIAIER
jgi:hypothetical protein